MENNEKELVIRKVNERQFDVILHEPGSVTSKWGMTYDEVNAFLWSLFGNMMYRCDTGKSVKSHISVKF